MPVDLSLLGLPAALRAVLATATPTAGLGGTGQRVSGTTVDAGITPVALQSGTAPQSGAGPQSGAAPQLGTAPQSGIAPQPGAAPGSGSAALPATTIPGQLISTRPGAAVDGSTPSGASVASRSPGSPVPAAGAGATPAETLASTVPASTVPASVVSASVLSTSGSSGNTVPGLRTAPAALITTAVTSLPANVRPAGAGEGSTSAPTAVTAVAGPAIAATVVATGNPASAVAGTQQASTSVAATDAAPATPTAAVAAPAMTAGDAGGGQDSGGQPGRPAQPVATAAATTRVVTEASSGAPVPVVPAAGPAVAQPGVTQTAAASRPVPVPDTDASTVPGTMPAPPASSVVTAPITSNVSTPPMPLPLTNPAAFAYGIAGRLGELAPETDALHRMTIEVNPQGLGPVRVTAEVSGGALHVSLVGASEAARHALSAAVGDLQRELVTSNFTSTSIDVRADSGATQQRFTGDSQFGGRPGQGQSQQSSGSEGGYPSTHAGSLFAADEARAGRRSSAAAAEGRLDLRV
ncbi:MAG: flagellar hook-length control protein FliK [Janthinobacterium lividum]